MVRFFGSNLVTGFVFGSVAKGCASRQSDIDTMVRLDRMSAEQIKDYLHSLDQYHRNTGMTADVIYPAEIITREFLEEALADLDSIVIDIEHTDPLTFDTIIRVEVLAGFKRGIIRDKGALFTYAKKVGRYPKLWKRQILDKLEKKFRKALPMEMDKRRQHLEQMRRIRQMEPALLMKRNVGLEHLSVEQCSVIKERVKWSLEALYFVYFK
jgi:predicted nucleotidyltransferase